MGAVKLHGGEIKDKMEEFTAAETDVFAACCFACVRPGHRDPATMLSPPLRGMNGATPLTASDR